MELNKRIIKNKNPSSFQDEQHLKNIEHMKRRIGDVINWYQKLFIPPI